MIPYGYCQCGCGEKTKRAKDTNKRRGHIKGEPLRFIHTHHARVSLKDRFWPKVKKGAADECWPWLAATDSHGYGQIMVGAYGTGSKPAPWKAHRVAWELTHQRPIPSAMFVLHRCDNPPCCNPNHLFLGDQAANMADAATKGRTRGTYTVARNPNRKLTAAHVLEARQEVAAGITVASLARRFGVSHSAMHQAVTGVTWKHLRQA